MLKYLNYSVFVLDTWVRTYINAKLVHSSAVKGSSSMLKALGSMPV